MKYYYAGSQRIAMRTGSDAPKYLLGDHLGSTSVMVNADGTHVSGSPQGYYPWGETRFGGVATEYRCTGQRESSSLGLYFYGARWYDTYLNRWTSPDNIVPLATQGTQALDRYAYANNNPLRYKDPTGHWIETALDLAFIAYDLYQINQEGWTLVNTVALAADVACAIVPVGTGGGPAVRVLASGGDIATAVNVASKAAANLPEAFRLGQTLEKGFQFFEGGNESLLQDLLDAANQPDRNGLVKSGRSIQKHGSRSGSVFPKISGNPSNFNSAGSNLVKEILSDPNSIFKYYSHPGYGNILDVWSSIGQGLRYRVSTISDKVVYDFMNFLEPTLQNRPKYR